ncbi:MAG: SpoIIE family protein phosphatase [Oscillospiraceae bacterium]|nr:SpoIIE family protein phosphatase [Oscillospiraceae bacterium]
MVTEKRQSQIAQELALPALSPDKLRRVMTALAQQLGIALLGMLLVQATFAGDVFAATAPFALGLAAALPVKFLAAGVLGMAGGSLLLLAWPSNFTVMTAVALAGLCNFGLRQVKFSRGVAAPLSASACAMLSGVVTLIAQPAGRLAWLLMLGGAVLAGCVAYFMHMLQGVTQQHGHWQLTRRQWAAAALCAVMLLTALGGFTWGAFRPAYLLAALFVLAAAYVWHETGGAIAGVCAGTAFLLVGSNAAVFTAFALGGLLVGVFSSSKRISWLSKLADKFAQPQAQLAQPGDASKRVAHLAQALQRVGDYVSEVAQGLAETAPPLEQNIVDSVEQALCKRCPRHAHCYEKRALETRKFYLNAVKLLGKSHVFSPEQCAELRRECGLTAACRNGTAFHAQLVRAFDAHAAQHQSAQANAQLRRTAAAQYAAVGQLLEDTAVQLARQDTVQNDTAYRAAQVLREHGYVPREVTCVRGSNHTATLTAEVTLEDDHSTRRQLVHALKKHTGIAFTLPDIAPGAGTAKLTMTQQAVFRMAIGAAQHGATPGSVCGDYHDNFADNQGRHVLLVSDGMGTGSRAGLESALAAEIFGTLVRGGLGFAAATRMVNQALLLKSSDESLATLDAVGVNLFTGQVEFCKAGGAVSWTRRSGRVQKVELSALPAGILGNINPAEHHSTLAAGDIIVLVSDGMLGTDDAWICETLQTWDGNDMQELADYLAVRAMELRELGGMREDDLTVLCASLLPLF